MTSIVIDTCTLKHADDPKSKYFEYSLEFIAKMNNNSINCTVDTGFSLDETRNASYIGFEYIKHLQPGSLGYELIVYLAINGRIDFVSNQPLNNIKNFIEQHIRNKKDRMFLRVAFNSADKLLVSHDFTDYQIKKRKFIKREIKVLIITAEEINDEL